MRIDPRTLRTCLGQFTTGVTVVTCEGNGAPHGATVNAFTSVSLDPALVLVALDRRSRACRYLVGKPFAVNVLRESQRDIALLFAGAGAGAGKRSRVLPAWELGGRVPRLADSLATVTCAPWAVYDGGDHVLFVGEVQELDAHGGKPLVFYGGEFRALMPESADSATRVRTA